MRENKNLFKEIPNRKLPDEILNAIGITKSIGGYWGGHIVNSDKRPGLRDILKVYWENGYFYGEGDTKRNIKQALGL